MLLTSFCLTVGALGGPYSLGHTSVAWPDPARANRVVTAEIWYPAAVAGNNVPIADAPGEGFPVLAFGHGFLMPAARYQYLWEALVPGGYVMALPTTGGELLPDHNEFALDLAFLVARLEQEAATTGSLFEGEISPLGAVGGHSMGGGASVLAAAADPTLEAVFNLAAAETSPSAVAAAALLTQPSLMLAGSSDCVTPIAGHQGPIHDALGSSCKHLVVLDGASHCQFASPDFFCNLGETCSAAMSEAAQQTLTAALVRNWLDAILLDDGSAWDGWLMALDDGGVLSVAGSCDPGPLRYCSAAPNSTGLPAMMSITGSTSIGANNLGLGSGPGPQGEPGIFYYGPMQIQAPFGNGFRCVGGPGGSVVRIFPFVLSSPGGFMSASMDNTSMVHAQLIAGATLNFQSWFRDPAAGGAGFNLSDGLSLTFGP